VFSSLFKNNLDMVFKGSIYFLIMIYFTAPTMIMIIINIKIMMNCCPVIKYFLQDSLFPPGNKAPSYF
jgi:hypothetical protein